jgi:hypothetical protein
MLGTMWDPVERWFEAIVTPRSRSCESRLEGPPAQVPNCFRQDAWPRNPSGLSQVDSDGRHLGAISHGCRQTGLLPTSWGEMCAIWLAARSLGD